MENRSSRFSASLCFARLILTCMLLHLQHMEHIICTKYLQYHNLNSCKDCRRQIQAMQHSSLFRRTYHNVDQLRHQTVVLEKSSCVGLRIPYHILFPVYKTTKYCHLPRRVTCIVRRGFGLVVDLFIQDYNHWEHLSTGSFLNPSYELILNSLLRCSFFYILSVDLLLHSVSFLVQVTIGNNWSLSTCCGN
jgi:hypothetical protein